jgi:hypothetical protein
MCQIGVLSVEAGPDGPDDAEITMDCERLERELAACRREISRLRAERDEWRDEALLLDRLLSDRRALIDARMSSPKFPPGIWGMN